MQEHQAHYIMGVERRLHGHVDVDVAPPGHVDLRFASAPPGHRRPPGRRYRRCRRRDLRRRCRYRRRGCASENHGDAHGPVDPCSAAHGPLRGQLRRGRAVAVG